jgi:hypothetical protein
MSSLFRAEWEKIAGNRWAVAFLVWIFPMGMLVFLGGVIVITLLSEDFRAAQTTLGIAPWNVTILDTWKFLNTEMMRYVIVIFSAIVFAGEYQYGTWKNLIPRRSRLVLILNKLLILGVFVTIAFVATTIISGIGTGIVAGMLGINYGPFDGETIRQFAGEYLFQMVITLSASLIAATYAAIAAMITRNIVASGIVGILITLAEQATLVLIWLIYTLLKINALLLYQLTPGYNLANISTWVQFNTAYQPISALKPLSLASSVTIVALIAVGLIGLTVYLFRRQDITT